MNLENAKEEFLKYVDTFDKNNERAQLKRTHSLRVMNISREIAQSLELTKEEIDIATLIGLLHDIARFEQITKYGTFKDSESFDHGDYGEKILKKDLRKYIKETNYDQIIMSAVKNHNKYKIEKDLDNKTLMFCKIIRDADKLDIFFEAADFFWKEEKQNIEKSLISKTIQEQFMNQIQVKKTKNLKIQGVNKIIVIIAFIYDINYKKSFEILKENEYINKMIDKFNFKIEKTKNGIEEIRKIANNYIDEKIR